MGRRGLERKGDRIQSGIATVTWKPTFSHWQLPVCVSSSLKAFPEMLHISRLFLIQIAPSGGIVRIKENNLCEVLSLTWHRVSIQ